MPGKIFVMKPKVLFLILALAYAQLLNADEWRLMTYNIRYDNQADAPHTWQVRKPLILKQIIDFDVDILGCQEALHHQVLDLEQGLPGYQRIGAGRDDGMTAGEYSPLFFKTDRFQLLESGTIWLSDTPEQVSKGWDAALPRIATWASLLDRTGSKKLLVVNTHFDHVGSLARLNSMKLIAGFINDKKLSHRHIIFMGDLNTNPGSEPYQWLMEQNLLTDSYYEAEYKNGPAGTFNAFRYEHQSDRIDYIFVDSKFPVLEYRVLIESHRGILPSDHWPVMVIVGE